MNKCRLCGKEISEGMVVCEGCSKMELEKEGKGDMLVEGVPIICRAESFKKFVEPLCEITSLIPKKILTAGVLKEVKLGNTRAGYMLTEMGAFEGKEGCLSLFADVLKTYDMMGFYMGALHEFGHLIEEQLNQKDRDLVEEAHEIINKNGVFREPNFGRFSEERAGVQSSDWRQFFGDFNAMYVLEGDELRDFIKDQPEQARSVYEKVYNIFKKIYQDKEFQYDDVEKFYEDDKNRREKELQDFAQFLKRNCLDKQQEIPEFQRKMFREVSGMDPGDWLEQLDEGKKPVSIPWWSKK